MVSGGGGRLGERGFERGSLEEAEAGPGPHEPSPITGSVSRTSWLGAVPWSQ